MKVLIRGGSVAAGHGANRGFGDILAEALQSGGIEVITRARYRETSFAGVATFEEDIAPFKPHILILNFGVDDAFTPVYRSEFQENLVQLVRRTRERFGSTVVMATSHTFANWYDMDAVYIYYRSMRIVAADLGCPIIPVHLRWDSFIEENGLVISDLVQADDRYPNDLGQEVIANAVLAGLQKVMAPK